MPPQKILEPRPFPIRQTDSHLTINLEGEMSSICRKCARTGIPVLVSCLFFLPTVSSYATDTSTTKAGEEFSTVQESKPLVARTGAWQTWNDYLHIKPGQEKRKLVLGFFNGTEGRAKMTGVHVQLARKPFATLEDFNAEGQLFRDLTGTIGVGNTPITVQGSGPSGARLVWKLLTDEIGITAVAPNPFGSTDTVTIQGKNFSDHPGNVKVLIDGKPAKVTSAQINQLEVKSPADLRSGDHDLIVAIDSVKSKPYKVKARPHPHIEKADFVATAPGQPLVITGTGFSRVPAENVVKFGSHKAEVTSASETSISCIVPHMDFPRWHVPISVTTRGVVAKGTVLINIDQRVIPNEGHPQL
jgi:hypothetical protein